MKEISSNCLGLELAELISKPELQEFYSNNSFQTSIQLNWNEILKNLDQKINQLMLMKKTKKKTNYLIILFTGAYVGWLIITESFKKSKI